MTVWQFEIVSETIMTLTLAACFGCIFTSGLCMAYNFKEIVKIFGTLIHPYVDGSGRM